MNQYEFMWIISSDTDEEDVAKLNKSLEEKIKNCNGLISVIENYGKRTLAHIISGNSEGKYFLSRFNMDPSDIKKLEGEILRETRIIRHLITKVTTDKPLLAALSMDTAPDSRSRRKN